MKYIGNEFYKNIVIILLTGAMLLGVSGSTPAAAAAQVNVSPMTQIDGEQILLGKIATIEGHDTSLINRISGIVIGRSPLPGMTRKFEASVVERRLRLNRIDLNQVELFVPDQVVVKRSVVEISQEKIKALVSEYISQNLLDNVSDARIKDIQVNDSLNLPGGRVTYTVEPSRNSDRLGKIPFTVSFNVNGKFYKRVWATATVEVFTEVVVTKKAMRRNKPITEDDIETQKMDLAKLPSDVITDPEVVLGQRTRRAIGSQTVLRSTLVEFPPLLKRGDVVVIIAETGGFKISALGRVKKKGRLGERIPVINFDSNKILYARVLDSNTVKVEFK